MVKRILKRILVFTSVACLVLACLPSVSFAIDPVSGAAALAGAIDAYGMAYGVGTVYDVSSSSGVSSSFEGLWDDFSEYKSNAGSQFDYDSFIDNYNQIRSLHGFEHSSGKFAAWSIDAESAEIFDQFWNWLLTGPAEMTRVDNEYFQFSSSQIGSSATPVVVGSMSSNAFALYSLPVISKNDSTQEKYQGSLTVGVKRQSNNTFTFASGSISDGQFVFFVLSNGTYSLYVAGANNNNSTNICYTTYYSSSGSYNALDAYGTSTKNSSLFSSTGLYYGSSGSPGTTSNFTPYAPVFNSVADALNSLSSYVSDPSAYIETVGVKADNDTGIVNIPNPYGQDYVPTPLDIVTNVPWDSTYDDTDEEDGEPVPFPPVDVPLVVDDIITAISAEDYALEEDPQNPDPDPPPPAPSEVFVPLLPVGLPSFNFSFSGIWHYVREWVASLGAWFTTLFTIWGALPYAMVVPVYATAVVVIVLGVYKRFFM